jgi:hypothetical protein
MYMVYHRFGYLKNQHVSTFDTMDEVIEFIKKNQNHLVECKVVKHSDGLVRG